MTKAIKIGVQPEDIIEAVKKMKKREREAFLEDLLAATSPDYLESIIAVMPIDSPGGSGLEGDSSYAWQEDKMFFSYEGRGGDASGTMYMLTEALIDHCDYEIDIVFSGSFDYETCSFQGTGSYSWS